jgi:hypothetical protein
MNNTMMVGLFALGGLAFFLIQRGDWRLWQGSLVKAPPAAQQRPDNPPANLTYARSNLLTGGAGTGYGVDIFGDEG